MFGHSRLGLKRTHILTLGFALVAVLLFGAWLTFGGQETARTAPIQRRNAVGEIIARGYIEPLGRVIAVSGPPEGGSTVALVGNLLVDQGSKVEAGQLLATLNGFDVSRTDYEVAKANLELAKLQYAQVKAGIGKSADIAAQRNVLAGRLAQVTRLEKDWKRTSNLVKNHNASMQSLDSLVAQLTQSKEDVGQARNALKALTEVRGVDLRVAEGQIAVAQANLAKAKAALDRMQIRAPVAGTVLSIQARAGEAIQADGILRMADLSHLIVVAEVDQAQIELVTKGMTATIEGPMLPNPVKAMVTRIAKEVYRQKRPSSDILVGRDAKIVEVELTPESVLPPVVGGEVTVHFMPRAVAQK